MSTYVARFKGYVADVPRLWFRRCDGSVFCFNKLTAFSSTAEPKVGWAFAL